MQLSKNQIFKLATVIGLGAIPAVSRADTDYNLIVSHVGVQGTQVYVSFTTSPSGGCAYDSVFVTAASGYLDYVLSLALTARASALPISRVDYTKAPSGACYVDLIEM